MILRRRLPDPHPAMLRELQMVGMLRMPDHNAVKALMIDKLAQPSNPNPRQYSVAISCNLSVGRAMRSTALAIDMNASTS